MLIASWPLPRSRSSSRFSSPLTRFSPPLSIVARSTSGLVSRNSTAPAHRRIGGCRNRSCARCCSSRPSTSLHRRLQPAGGQQIALLDEVEQRVVVPGRVLKAAVAMRRLDHRLGFAAEKALRRALPQASCSRSITTAAPGPGARGRTSSAPSSRRRRRRSPAGLPSRSLPGAVAASGNRRRGVCSFRRHRRSAGPIPRRRRTSRSPARVRVTRFLQASPGRYRSSPLPRQYRWARPLPPGAFAPANTRLFVGGRCLAGSNVVTRRLGSNRPAPIELAAAGLCRPCGRAASPASMWLWC